MDQIEFENHIEKMKHRVEEGDYKTAAKVADKIDWENVTDINLLIYVAAIYENINDYLSAKAILEYAYSIAPIKNRLYFALCSINIKLRELKEARDYFVDFCMSFPNDPRKHLLKYYFLKAKGADIDQQIRLLKDYTEEEKEEDMLYELALLYDKIDNREKVIETCNFIIDFFGVKINGYGKDALLLKKKYVELNDYERNLLFDAEYNMRNKEPSAVNYALGEDDRIASIQKTEEKTEEETHRVLEEDLKAKQEPIVKIVREEQASVVPNQNEADKIVSVEEASEGKQPEVSYTPDSDSYQPNKKEMAFLNAGREEQKEKLKDLIKKLQAEGGIDASEDIVKKESQEEVKAETAEIVEEAEPTEKIEKVEPEIISPIKEEEEEEEVNIPIVENIYEQKKEEEELKKELKKLYREEPGFNPYRKESFELLRRFKSMNTSIKLNMIIEAYSKEEAMDIAKSELKYIHREKGEDKKIVKVSAYNINDNGFDYYLQKLGNRDLVIENAGRLTDKAIDEIEEYIVNKRNKNIIVLSDIINNFDKMADKRPTFIERFDIYSVLSEKERPAPAEDSEKEKQDAAESDKMNFSVDINEFMNKNEEDQESKKHILSEEEKEKLKQELRQELKEEEKRRQEKDGVQVVKNDDLIEEVMKKRKELKENPIKIKKEQEMSEDDFVEFCKNYAKSIDCVLQGKTIPVIYECIEDMKEAGIELTEENAVNLIEDAADRAEKPKLFSKPKYDKEGCLILSEEHFL